MSVTKIMSTKLPTVVEHDHADRQWHDLVGREAVEDARGGWGGAWENALPDMMRTF